MDQILVIEDNMTMREGIIQILSRAGYDVRSASSGKEGVEIFKELSPDFVITDLKMEDMDGMGVLSKIREVSSDALIMIITAFGTIETAVEAMKLGAFDFITKPFPPDLLRVKVAHAIEVIRMKSENQFLRSENQREHPDTMIGMSKVITEIREQIARVAPTETSVLITGESGTGKELVARALHTQSKRSQKPFVKVDCSALAEGVLESELFGHERGAFTGATNRKLGRFELANGGTIFLDEIGNISPAVQLKLLRVLQDRCFERVGGTKTIKVDVRVVSATNKKLIDEVKTGSFREDLYYRLHIVPIFVPALRERKEDVPLLVRHFCKSLARKYGRQIIVTPLTMEFLCEYYWPGNIRELENLLERIYVLAPGGQITPDSLPEELKKSNNHVHLELPAKEIPLNEALEQLERQLILRAFNKASGIKTKTAQLLGIKTSALYYKLEKYGITEVSETDNEEFQSESS